MLGPRPPSDCQYCFDDGAYKTTAGSVEFPYFDALHKQMEASYCVDKNRQFFGGYSSGGWLAQELGCQFPDVLRAQGNVTGGLPPVIQNGTQSCKDHPIAAFLLHDLDRPVKPVLGVGGGRQSSAQAEQMPERPDHGHRSERALHDRRRHPR